MPLILFQTANSVHAIEISGLELASGENQKQQDQEITLETPKIKVDVSLVTTDVTVIGESVSDLRAEDFLIFDNDVPQQINHLSRDMLPLAVAILIDRSTSITEFLPLLQSAAISALGRLKPADQVALFAFDSNPLKLSDLTGDHDLLAKIIGKLTIGSSTNIYDAIITAARYLRLKAPNRRRAIILISDNCHTMPGGSSGDSARVAVLESAATLYSLQTPGESYSVGEGALDQKNRDSIAWVRQIAEETSGEILNVAAPKSLQAALEKAISNLRLQYTLGFNPSRLDRDGSFHRLTVKLASEDRCPGCKLLARSGYYAGIPSPLPPANDAGKVPGESEQKVDPWSIQLSILAAESIDVDLADIPFTVKTLGQKDSAGKGQIRIDLQVDFAGIAFRTVGSQHTCRLHIAVFDVDAKRKVLGSEWKTLEGQLKDETYNRITRNGLSFSLAIPQRAREQTLKIVLYDEGSGTLGSKLVNFR